MTANGILKAVGPSIGATVIPLRAQVSGSAGIVSAGVASVTGAGQSVQHSDAQPGVLRSVTAQLVTLPEPLRLRHGPILVTIETWSDDSVVARLPAARLDAVSHDDATAIDELGDEIFSFLVAALVTFKGNVGGVMARQLATLLELIDASGLVQK